MGDTIALRGGPYTCPYCNGLTYVPNEGRQRSIVNPAWLHCGRPTCKRAHKAARVKRYYREYRQRTGIRYQSRYETPSWDHCRICGDRIKHRPYSTRCSPCTHEARKRERIRRERQRRTRTTLDIPRLWTAGRCPRCGDHFVAVSYSGPSRYCSSPCKNADRKARRRARTAGAKITAGRRYAIMERDRWTCQLCGKRLHRRRTAPHPKAPVIDHILPLAAGGDDAEHNWQAAHFICNSAKRELAGPHGDQLRLPA